MKSGLEDRNNPDRFRGRGVVVGHVSMKSGLEDRNNCAEGPQDRVGSFGLNEVRPRRPEQSETRRTLEGCRMIVSMKSGLEDRNNQP